MPFAEAVEAPPLSELVGEDEHLSGLGRVGRLVLDVLALPEEGPQRLGPGTPLEVLRAHRARGLLEQQGQLARLVAVVRDVPEAGLGEHDLALAGDEIAPMDRVAVGLDVVGPEPQGARVVLHEAVEGPRALLVLDHPGRSALDGLYVETRVFLAAVVAREHEELPVGGDVGEARAVLAPGHLDGKALGRVQAPEGGRARGVPDEEQPLAVGGHLAQAGRAHVEHGLDAAAHRGVEGRRRVLADGLGREAIGAVAGVGGLRGGFGGGDRQHGRDREDTKKRHGQLRSKRLKLTPARGAGAQGSGPGRAGLQSVHGHCPRVRASGSAESTNIAPSQSAPRTAPRDTAP